MKAAEYHSVQSVSASSLKWFRKSPAHFKAALDGKLQSESTPAQIRGTMLHSLVLECRADYVVAPETYDGGKKWNRNATFCKEWESAQTKPVIRQHEADTIQAAAMAVRENRLAARLLIGGDAEKSFFVKCKRTGLDLKSRMDYWTPRWIVDLKTTEDASFSKFKRSAASYDYEMQAAFYCYVSKLSGHEIVDFYFIALELEPLPMVNVFLIEPDDLEIATAKLMKELDAVAKCFESNHWPGYCDNAPTMLSVPPWKFESDEPEKLDMEN